MSDASRSPIRRVRPLALGAVLGLVMLVLPAGHRPASGQALPTLGFRHRPFEMVEGPAETRSPLRFEIRLSAAVTDPVTFSYTTSNGTAVSPGDYRGVTGTRTIHPGKRFAHFDVS